MNDDQIGRRLKWKTTKMEDNKNGRQPKWKTNRVEDDKNGRNPKCRTTKMEVKKNLVRVFSKDKGASYPRFARFFILCLGRVDGSFLG